MGKASAPPAPDYRAAAQETASGNLENSRVATKANRVNTYTPYGSLTYQQAPGDQDSWTSNVNLAPDQQKLLDQQNKTSMGLSKLQDTGTQRVANQFGQGWNDSALPQATFNPGDTGQDAIMRRLQPQFDRDQSALENRLQNQGITQGSEAYNNAMDQFGRTKNDAYSQAALQGISLGQQGRQQGLQEQQYFNSRDLNLLNALRTGAQVTNPTFSSSPQQGQVAGPDMLGATQAGYNAQLQGVNAQNAASGNFMNGLFGLGGAALGAPAGTFSFLSDVRLKEGIKPYGRTASGYNLYTYRYKWGGPVQIGVMAQEVMQTNPDAVAVHPSGYLMVNYGAL